MLKNGFKNIIAIGSAFIYLEKIYKFKNIKPKGTLIFPLLSQPELKNKIDYDKILKDLKKISQSLHYKCISQRY